MAAWAWDQLADEALILVLEAEVIGWIGLQETG